MRNSRIPKPDREPLTLGALANAMADTAVQLQRRFNEDHAAALHAVQSSTPVGADTSLARHLAAGSRQKVATCTIGVRAELKRSRAASGALRITPLNLGYEAMFGTATTGGSRLELTITQSPATNLQPRPKP